MWDRKEAGGRWSDAKRFVHPQVVRLYLFCQNLPDPDQSQSVLVFTATPGTRKPRQTGPVERPRPITRTSWMTSFRPAPGHSAQGVSILSSGRFSESAI
ncbi:hypothetical protein [Streptomyces sp. MBT53]|uniref:MmyB family transcriptional regulator n=1 Tax=Streptomyces sp. MBT53 TaxID=1488384 RepID=UPI0027DA1A57|nr:hypothetical protein [Streptomyces sp. MBT53]